MAPDAMTCIEMCAGVASCSSVDYNPGSFECVLHGLDDSCRDSVDVAGWFTYKFANCGKYGYTESGTCW